MPAWIAFALLYGVGLSSGYAAFFPQLREQVLPAAQAWLAASPLPTNLFAGLLYAYAFELLWLAAMLLCGLQHVTLPLLAAAAIFRPFCLGLCCGLCKALGLPLLFLLCLLPALLSLPAELGLFALALKKLFPGGRAERRRTLFSDDAFLRRGMRYGAWLLVIATVRAAVVPVCLSALLLR